MASTFYYSLDDAGSHETRNKDETPKKPPKPPPRPRPTKSRTEVNNSNSKKPLPPPKPQNLSRSPTPKPRVTPRSQPSTPRADSPDRPIPPPRKRRQSTNTTPTTSRDSDRPTSLPESGTLNRPVPPPRIQNLDKVPPLRPLPFQPPKLIPTDIPSRSASDSQTRVEVIKLPLREMVSDTCVLGDGKGGTFPRRSSSRRKGWKSGVNLVTQKKTSEEEEARNEDTDEEDKKLKTSPSIRKKLNSAFSAIKSFLRSSGGNQTSAVGDGDGDGEGEDEADYIGKLNFVPKLRHTSFSAGRRTGTLDSKTSLDQGDDDGGQLFQHLWVVKLKEKEGALVPFVDYRFPPKFAAEGNVEEERVLESVPQFCFPDVDELKPMKNYRSETYSFVLTDMEGGKRFGYCRRVLSAGSGPRFPLVYCIISPHGCFDLYSKILDIVALRLIHGSSNAYSFLKSVIAQPFPSPGKSVNVQSFAAGHDGMEVVKLRRPLDSARLEHVDFEALFNTLSVETILTLFSALLMERHVILSAAKLSTLSDCINAAIALLYPFSWQHVFIPVLPKSLVDFCSAPSPYLIGILTSVLPQLQDQVIEEDVLILNLESGHFEKRVGDEENILPSKLRAALKSALKGLEGKKGSRFHGTEQSSEGSTIVVEAFVRFFVESIGHYHNFLPKAPDDEFDWANFAKAPHSKGLREFLGNFKNTQAFNVFVDERRSEEERQTFSNSLFERRLREQIKESSNFSVIKAIGGKFKGFGAKLKKKMKVGGTGENASEDEG